MLNRNIFTPGLLATSAIPGLAYAEGAPKTPYPLSANVYLVFVDATDGTMCAGLNASYAPPFLEGLSAVGHVGYTNYGEKPVTRIDNRTKPSNYKDAASFSNGGLRDLARAAGYITAGRMF